MKNGRCRMHGGAQIEISHPAVALRNILLRLCHVDLQRPLTVPDQQAEGCHAMLEQGMKHVR
jgi:hypothetical protein